MPHKSRVRRQTHVGSAPELLGEIGITFSFGAFPKAPAKLFPSRGLRAPPPGRADSFGGGPHFMEGNKAPVCCGYHPETDRRKSIRLPLPGGDSVTLFSAKSMA